MAQFSMMGALKPIKSCVRSVADVLFPEAMYARRIRKWAKDESEIALLPVLCRSDAISVDVGANQGLFVWHLLPLSQHVVAFEPLPAMLQILRARYGRRIQLESVILSDHDGTGELRFPKGNYAWATVAESNSLSLAKDKAILTITAPMKTLDSFDLKNVGFIKIDVEGHEEAVLKGGIETLKRSKPNLLTEIEERHSPQSLQRAAALLEELGYVGYYLDGKTICPLDQFDLSRDQPLQNVSELGKIGRYINNFMFFPEERAKRLVKQISERAA